MGKSCNQNFELFLKGRREELFKANPKYKKFYNFIKKNDNKLSPEQLTKVEFERTYLQSLIQRFITILNTISTKGLYLLCHGNKC